MKNIIYDLQFDELANILTSEFQQPLFRANQLWNGIYKNFWNIPDDFTNFPKTLREKLFLGYEFAPLTPIKILHSSDEQTEKILFQLHDGQAIETVLMKYDQRNTLCISTQAGCAMGCVFCATGQMGFKRNLTAGEIVEQVLYFARELSKIGEKVTNIVLMGMGEPFHNYEASLKAIDILNNPNGFGLGARRFTISTVGLVPMIKRFADENRQVNLAVSLHAVNDQERSSMMPVNNKYPIKDIMDACKYYFDQTHRRITFEWALIAGKNDSEETAENLAKLLKGLICHVNVIPLNPTSQSIYQAASKDQTIKFQKVLERNGVPCTIRLRRGIDIQAGCGQLAISHSTGSV
ncbi:MAG TPA: 23S rRNA (adenine(2503)-C(2))-methyltransferase RlmN [Anaerolineaceae bacterium]|nr:23S rRNA (adenine(2503)-C(2))-methyltransferase RlmN [Anaerolineaceae bacterium]